MRQIDVLQVVETVERLCITSNYELNSDILKALEDGIQHEDWEIGRRILCQLVENAGTAARERLAICQDTGMAVVFVDIGQDVHITGGSLSEAINEGVRRGYEKGCLRKSVVSDPLERINTGDNTPAVIHYDIIEGDSLKITVAPKGFGSENMSGIKMLKPSDGIHGVRDFILEMVEKAGPNPCPPVVVGVGLGGTMEKAALLAKRAILRPISSGDGSGNTNNRNVGSNASSLNINSPNASSNANSTNASSGYRKLEEELLQRINELGIGPAGLGGRLTAMAVNIEVYPTHIAGLPVAVNMSCHVTRHAEAVL